MKQRLKIVFLRIYSVLLYLFVLITMITGITPFVYWLITGKEYILSIGEYQEKIWNSIKDLSVKKVESCGFYAVHEKDPEPIDNNHITIIKK